MVVFAHQCKSISHLRRVVAGGNLRKFRGPDNWGQRNCQRSIAVPRSRTKRIQSHRVGTDLVDERAAPPHRNISRDACISPLPFTTPHESSRGRRRLEFIDFMNSLMNQLGLGTALMTCP